MKNPTHHLLKLIGVLLFVWILATIDMQVLIGELMQANIVLLAISFPLVFLIYFCKTQRWKVLVHTSGISLPFRRHWEIVNVGIFLACIMPGKIGEMGKAAYLKATGMKMVSAITITILDRVIDTVFIGVIAAVGTGILFGWYWTALAAVGIVIGIVIVITYKNHLGFVTKYLPPQSLLPIAVWTLCSLAVHFVWAILLARAVGIATMIPILIAVLTFAGMLSLLPIAPSGLGTRDAALVFFLSPYGVTAEQSVALAFLMFLSIIVSGLLGGYYFLKEKG